MKMIIELSMQKDNDSKENIEHVMIIEHEIAEKDRVLMNVLMKSLTASRGIPPCNSKMQKIMFKICFSTYFRLFIIY